MIIVRILAVDADETTASNLAQDLQRHGHEVRIAPDGSAALAGAGWAQLVLLDPDLPDLDGVRVCREIRDAHDTHIIILSRRGAEVDRVLGLKAGSDDYVVKPYGFQELLARIDAVTRRAKTAGPTPPAVAVGLLRANLRTYEVHLGGRPVPTTRKEFDLLHLLIAEAGEVVPRSRIMAEIWQDSLTPHNSRTIDTHVNTLRRKLGDSSWILTVRGVGFRLGGARRAEPA